MPGTRSHRATSVVVAGALAGLVMGAGPLTRPLADVSLSASGSTTVVAVSIDGLNPRAIRALGPDRAPALHRLIDEGAYTLNARTARELTDTLPNHTGMLTARRVNAVRGGHGVTWNDERREPPTVRDAAGEEVSSVFSVVHAAGGRPALFASKSKFSLFERSWDLAIDPYVFRADNSELVDQVLGDLADQERAFRFVHLSGPDAAGHDHGFMTAGYLSAVEAADQHLGRILDAIEGDPDLTGRTVLVVTSDHGGRGSNHRDPTRLANYRVPFLVWGRDVTAGSLYGLNPGYRHPERRRTSYADARQPVRNGAVANLVTDLLGLGSVPGSEHNVEQDLDVR